MHSSLFRGWGCGLIASSLLAFPAWADGDRPVFSPDQAVALALSTHPSLHAAEAALRTSEAERSAAAVFLDNPSATAWFSPDGRRAEVGVSQPLSITGEGWHARAAARHRIEATSASWTRRARQVASAVRHAYVEAVVATGQVSVAQEGAALASRLCIGVRRKREVGEASALDVHLACLSEAQAAVRRLEAQRAQAEALTALSGWVSQPVLADELDRDPLSAVPARAIDRGASRSDLAAAEQALDAARLDLRRARAATMPPIALGVGVRVEDGQAFVGPSVGLALPLFDRNQVDRVASRGAVEVAAAEVESLRARATSEQTTAVARREEADRAVDRIRVDRDEARAALASIESGVLAGEIDLSTAVLLQTQVLQGEAAVVALWGQVAAARIDERLAFDDDALRGGAP